MVLRYWYCATVSIAPSLGKPHTILDDSQSYAVVFDIFRKVEYPSYTLSSSQTAVSDKLATTYCINLLVFSEPFSPIAAPSIVWNTTGKAL